MTTGEPPPTEVVINGRYELKDVVGTGGMGVVYRAHDRVLDRTVAVKVIREELADAEFVRRFEREAAILARVRSPHIVVVFDYGSTGRQFYLVTDFLAGGDLAGWLEDHGPMPPEQAVPLVAAVAEALADAHEHGVIHRDVKPGNVLLWRRGSRLHPVLADFGIAVSSDLSFTATGRVVGSPPFMAPERHLGQAATEATDIYAVGCLLYNVLTGDMPFPGTSFQMAFGHINGEIPSLPSTVAGADRLDRVIARCMAKDPADRYASAADLVAALRPLVPAEPTPAEDPPPPGNGPRPGSGAPTTVVGTEDEAATVDEPMATERRPRRRLAVVGAALAVLLVAVGVAGALRWSGDDDPAGAAGPSPAPSSEAPAVPAPGRVSAEVVRGDRAVDFRVDLPPPVDGVETTVERQDEDREWRPSETAFTVPTPAGGRPGCAVVRLVNRVGTERAEGEQRRLCGRAAAPEIELRGVLRATCAVALEGQSIPCDWFDVVVRGFRTGASLTLKLRFSTGPEVTSYPLVISEDGTDILTRRERDSDFGGLCPDQVCPGGFPAPRATPEATLWVTDQGGKVLARLDADLDSYR